jgi:hypothetical protein
LGYWLRYSLFFSISAQTCIKRKKSHGGVNDVRFGSKADILGGLRDVRFVPKADILRCNKERHYWITSSAMVRLFSEQTFKNLARPSLEPTTRL